MTEAALSDLHDDGTTLLVRATLLLVDDHEMRRAGCVEVLFEQGAPGRR